jgi:hypothetical protein
VTTELALLLDDVADLLRAYVVLSRAQAVALSLWIAHSHAFDAATATAYLAVTSAEKRSGKTRLLEVLELLVARPWLTGRTSAAALVRKIATEGCTLLLDESDAAFNAEKEYAEALRGILNSGHRRGGCASLCVGVGTSMSVVDFPVFGPKAIAGIGRLPDTVEDRAIRIVLKRRAPGERVERFRRRDVLEVAEPIAISLASWAEYAAPLLAEARPALPEELDDRAQDGWEPLLAIADEAGAEWPDRARRAALALSAADLDDLSLGVRLLLDVRRLFDEHAVDRFSTKELIAGLVTDEEAPWQELPGRPPKPLSPHRLAVLLDPFEVRSRSVRLPDGTTPKGFHREQFADAWSRYVPADAISERHIATTTQPSGFEPDFKAPHDEACGVLESAANPLHDTVVAAWRFGTPEHGGTA